MDILHEANVMDLYAEPRLTTFVTNYITYERSSEPEIETLYEALGAQCRVVPQTSKDGSAIVVGQ